jgi:RimJ/RimL family protein N-acetyltransferase
VKGTLRLEGGSVILRAASGSEIEQRVRAHLRGATPPGLRRTPEGLRKRFTRSGRWNGGRLDLVIEANSQMVGSIQAWRGWSHGIPPGVGELGIGVDDTADRGKGYGTEAVRLLAAWLLENGLDRVQASTDVTNAAARRVLERAGFEFEGVLRGYLPGDRRERADYAMYALVN